MKSAVILIIALAMTALLLFSCRKRDVEYVPQKPDAIVNLTNEPLPYSNANWMAYIDG